MQDCDESTERSLGKRKTFDRQQYAICGLLRSKDSAVFIAALVVYLFEVCRLLVICKPHNIELAF
eukprot:jgi/Antlo1/247/1121